MTVTPVEEFLKKPPVGFSVELLGSGYRVHSDAEKSLVLIDDFDSCMGKIVFQNSLGRWETHFWIQTHTFLSIKQIDLKVSDLFSTTGKLRCRICGSTPAWGRVCCPRGSICWCVPVRRSAQPATRRQPVKWEVTKLNTHYTRICVITVKKHMSSNAPLLFFYFERSVYFTALGCSVVHTLSWWLMLASKPPDLCTGWSREIKMTACFSAPSQSWLFFPSPMISISSAAVRGVHRWQRSFHQVADGERSGLDHLLCRWGKLQGGCKQSFVVFHIVWCSFYYDFLWLRSDFSLCQVDLTEPLESWAEKNIHVLSDKPIKTVWTDASFTLKYYSDALFDFPHWFGFSKRKFKVI